MAEVHRGSKNVDFQMKKYIYKRRADGTFIINLHKTWEKIILAARIIVAIENPKDVCAISARPYGQRAVFKFANYVGATPIAGACDSLPTLVIFGLEATLHGTGDICLTLPVMCGFRALHSWCLHQPDPEGFPRAALAHCHGPAPGPPGRS